MNHSITAVAAIIAAAGFAGAVQAQSQTPPGTPPSQNMQSTQYTGQTPSQPNGPQSNPYPAQQQPGNAQVNAAQQSSNNPQWNAAQQPAPGTANWNQAQQNGMQPAMTPAQGFTATQQPGGSRQFWSQNVSRDAVRQAQQQLRAQGLYQGSDDGVIGSSTKRSISQFQRRNGLQVTGSLDEATLDRLGGPSGQGYGASAGQPSASAQPMGAPAMNQAPNTGAYNPSAGSYNTAGTTPQGNPPMQR
jgi:hypothetical protein